MIESTKGARREVIMPAATLVDLLGLARAADETVLREHGQSAGRLLAERLLSPEDRAASARALPTRLFWKRVGELFHSRGWGTLVHNDPGDAVGELRATDWIEAERPEASGSCAFTAGALQGLLERVSGARLEVEEVECRATGGGACRFLFGSAPALAVAARSGRSSPHA
ncbi:MAG TPA: V4R domain-containing protein [Longimicrobiales bacterium]|nr:V4R domain-containing protein [Longimicrobiales bacterium]